MPSILQPFYERVAEHLDKLLFCFLNVDGDIQASHTYQSFLDRTSQIAAYLYDTNPLRPGERVLLAYPPGIEMIAAFFACVRLGLIPVPVYPPTSHGFQSALYKMTFIARDCDAAVVLTERAYYWSMKLNRTRNRLSKLSFKRDYIAGLKWIVTTDAPSGNISNFPERHTDILFLQYTSGSTSHPKGVIVHHQNILHNCDSVVDHLPVGVSWLPQYHDMGLIGYYLFFAMKGGTTYGFSPLDFIQRPALWLETISKYRGTASSAPNFAYEYCLRPDKMPAETFQNLDLSSLRFLMTAAEPIRPHIYRQFLEKFQLCGLQANHFFAAYGLAEFTLAVSNYGRRILTLDAEALKANRVEELPAGSEQSVDIMSCGRLLENTEVRIVRDGQTLPSGKVGEIWLNGASKCAGYWDKDGLSEQVFEARLTGDKSSWLRTGDLGFLHESELYVCGRSKDVIIIRGLNYYPQDVECIAEEEPVIRKGCSAAFGVDDDGEEKLILVAEVRDHGKLPDSQTLNRQIQQRLGIAVDVFTYVQARSISKTSSGKIRRHDVRDQWRRNELKTIAMIELAGRALSQGEIRSERVVTDIFMRFGLSVSDTSALSESGLDSLRLAELTHDLKDYLASAGMKRLEGQLDLRLLQKIPVAELFQLLADLENASPNARLRFQRAFRRLRREHQEIEQAQMRRDSKFRYRFSDVAQQTATGAKNNILLTGGTGFFGPFLLASLLEQSDGQIYVLVRAKNLQEGKLRLLSGLQLTGKFAPDHLSGMMTRVHPLCGDLARPQLGLDKSTLAFLQNEIAMIYQNGAMVNYLFDYETLRPANVNGTAEMLQFAFVGRPKIINYISTTFVFGWSVKDTLFESDNNADLDLLDFGYSQSKWVAEQVVKDAMRQGAAVRIFRPALISPAIDGGGYNFDISVRLLAFMLKHGITTDAANQVSFMPADIAANNIVAIGNSLDSPNATYHVTRDQYASMEDITDIFSRLTGKVFRTFPIKEFVPEVIDRCKKEDLLFPLLDFLVRSIDNITDMEFKRYDNSNYRQARDRSEWGKADPPLEQVVGGILRFMEKQGIVEALRS